MKALQYLLIAISILGIIATGCNRGIKSKENIVIQANETNVSEVPIAKSAQIISNRLKSFGVEKFVVTPLPERNQINVHISGEYDQNNIERLLIQKGKLAFFETYSRDEFYNLITNNSHLPSLLNTKNVENQSDVVGCASVSEMEKINDCLDSLNMRLVCKLIWNKQPNDSIICLYALKSTPMSRPLLVNEDIESVNAIQNTEFNNYTIEIKLKPNVIDIWHQATIRNLNKSVAIVLDNQILSAPVVRSEINSGRCSITGNFDKSEANFIVAVTNNEELPLDFKIVK